MRNPLSYRAFRALFPTQVVLLIAVGFLRVGLSLAARAIGRNELARSIFCLTFVFKRAVHDGLVPLAGTIPAGQPFTGMPVGPDAGRILPHLPMGRVTDARQIIRGHTDPNTPVDPHHLRDIPATGPTHRNRHACYGDWLHPHWSGSQA